MTAKAGIKKVCDKCQREIGVYGFKRHYNVCEGPKTKRTIRFSPGGWNKGLTKDSHPSLSRENSEALDRWFRGESKLVFSNAANARRRLKPFLIQKFGPSCCLCGFKAQHPDDGRWVIEIDHIDGDSENNHPSNLRLLCPNCHAMTPTNSGRNKRLKRGLSPRSSVVRAGLSKSLSTVGSIPTEGTNESR